MVGFFIGESSQDEEEEVKPVTVKFAHQESEEAKARRMASFDYLQKKQQEEMWQQLEYHNINVCTVLSSLFSGYVRLNFTLYLIIYYVWFCLIKYLEYEILYEIVFHRASSKMC